MKKILTLIMFIFINFIYCQNSNEFTYIITAKNGKKYYSRFEKETINSKEYWMKVTNPIKKTKNKNGKTIVTGGGYELVYLSIDCENKTYSTLSSFRYNNNDEIIAENIYNDIDFRIIPNSVMEMIHKFACIK